MLANRATRSYQALPPTQEAALGAIASVVIMHLEDERLRPTDAAPLLVQVDGPGDAELVDMVADCLREPTLASERTVDVDGALGVQPEVWTVIRFDAWQYQRLAPPWWWLIAALDKQLCETFRKQSPFVRLRKKLLDYGWRIGQFLKDLVPVMPLVFIALALWFASGELAMGEFVKWATGVIGGLATLTVLLWSSTNAVRRLFVASPFNRATTRASDPTADLQLRYSFLIRSAGTPVALVIDNLDRCRAEYVVELLEGIQTLLRNPPSDMGSNRLVAVLVPAERGWLCDSYLQVYKEFQHAMQEPGRLFGLAFVERVFNLVLRLPRMSPPSFEQRAAISDALQSEILQAKSEIEIRRIVADAECQTLASQPMMELRRHAVRCIGKLEVGSTDRLCLDTARDLATLLDAVSPGPTVARQLRTAYCVQRTRLLIGGHPVDKDEDAIRRLGLWTILDLRWPLLAQHLARHPEHVAMLKNQEAPADVNSDLEEVFNDPEAAWLITVPEAELTPDSIRRFSSSPFAYGHSAGLSVAISSVGLLDASDDGQ
jgi:hypothetical protein